MHAFLVASVLVMVSAPGDAQRERDCSVGASHLENAIASRLITRSNWQAFRHVARLRRNRGLEVLPGMIGCPDLPDAVNDLKSDAATRLSLRRVRLSPKDYLEIGWAVLIANDPEAFQANQTPEAASNIAFIAKHRVEVSALLGQD